MPEIIRSWVMAIANPNATTDGRAAATTIMRSFVIIAAFCGACLNGRLMTANHPLQTFNVSAYGESGMSIHLGFGQRLKWTPT